MEEINSGNHTRTLMEIFFHDPGEIPLPPDEIRIKNLKAVVQPSGKMVKIFLELDSFQKPPNVDLSIHDKQNNELAAVSIIETIQPKIELMMHLFNPSKGSNYTLAAELYYSKYPDSISEQGNPDFIERNVVDSARITLSIPFEN